MEARRATSGDHHQKLPACTWRPSRTYGVAARLVYSSPRRTQPEHVASLLRPPRQRRLAPTRLPSVAAACAEVANTHRIGVFAP